MKKLDYKTMYLWPLSYRMAVMAVLFVVFAFLGYRFDITSMQKNLDNVRQQQDDLKQQLQLAADQDAQLFNNLTQFNSLQTLLNDWRNQLIHNNELTEILNNILKSGGDNHLYFSLFNPGVEVTGDSFSKIPIKVVVLGSYQQIANFISQVANLKKIVVIGDFTLTNDNKSEVLGAKLAEMATAQNLLTAELSLEVYRYKETQAHETKV